MKRGESGSLLLLALFLCLGATVLLAAFGSVFLLGRSALEEEKKGKVRLSALEQELGRLAALSPGLHERIPQEGTSLEVDLSEGAGEDGVVKGLLRRPADRTDTDVTSLPVKEGTAPLLPVVEGEVRLEANGDRGVLGAWIESARDGLDLPRVPVVAGSVTASALSGEGRILADAGDSSGTEAPSVAVATGAQPAEGILGEGVVWEQLPRAWSLDAVTKRRLQSGDRKNSRCRPADRTAILEGNPGEYVEPPAGLLRNDPSTPSLVIAGEGVSLDARDLGDVYGVLVSDGGSIALEGTTLHGAVHATRVLRLGNSGAVHWDDRVFRWATDRSFVRLRLMPGSRYEYPRQ